MALVAEFWAPVQEPLDAIWSSLTAEPPRPITSGFLSAAYSRIVGLSGRNFLSFFRVVYGDWDAPSANEAFAGECARWAAAKFRESARGCEGGASGSSGNGPIDLARLTRLSQRVHLLQRICNALFNLPDKQRLDRGKMLYGGSAPSMAEIIEVVYYGTVVRDCQRQLFTYACAELDRARGGEACEGAGLSAVWGTLRYFRAVAPTDTVASPALHRLREDRARLYRELAVTCYADHMCAFYRQRSAAMLSDAAASQHDAFLPWAIAAMRREAGYLASAGFPSDIAAAIHLALLRAFVAPTIPRLLASPRLSPAAALTAGDVPRLAQLWAFARPYFDFNIYKGCAFEARRRVDAMVEEQQQALRAFSDALLAGAVAAVREAAASAPSLVPSLSPPPAPAQNNNSSNTDGAVASSSPSRPSSSTAPAPMPLAAPDVRASAVGRVAAQWATYRAFAAEHLSGYGALGEQLRTAVRRSLADGGIAAGAALESPPREVAAAIGLIVGGATAAAALQDGGEWALLREVAQLCPLVGASDALGLELRRGLGLRLLRRSDRAAIDREREACSVLRALGGCQPLSAALVAMIDDVEKSKRLGASFADLSGDAASSSSSANSCSSLTQQQRRAIVSTSADISIMVLKKVNWSPFVHFAPFRTAFLALAQRCVGDWYQSVHPSAQAEAALEVTVSICFGRSKRIAEFTGTKPHIVDTLIAVSRARTPPSVAELAAALGLPPRTVGMAASFLRARGALRVAGGAPPGAPLRDASRLEVDADAMPRARKASIDPPPTREETAAAGSRAADELTHLRAHHLQIALVRVMKRRKDECVPHDVLMSEALSLVNTFSPQPSAVKRQIEELIRKDIIERDDEVLGAYRYRL